MESRWPTVLIVVLVSAVTSALVTLAFHFTGSGPSKSKPLAAPEEGNVKRKSESADSEMEGLERELTALETEVKSTRSDIQANTERVLSLVAMKETEKEEAVRAVLQNLLELREPGRQRDVTKWISELLEFGNRAVPLIAEILASGTDQSYGKGFGGSGNTITRYPSLRSALLDALCQIGTPEAKKVVLTALENPTSLRETTAALILFGDSEDSMIIQGLSSAMSATVERIGRGDLNFTADDSHLFNRHFLRGARRLRLAEDPPFLERVKSAIKQRQVKDPAFGCLLALYVDGSPEEAWRLVCEKNQGPERVPMVDFLMSVDPIAPREMNLPKTVRFLELAIQSPALMDQDRDTIKALILRTTSLAVRGESKEGLQELLILLKFVRDMESNPEEGRTWVRLIERVERRLKE
jgi:hypothetical protein